MLIEAALYIVMALILLAGIMYGSVRRMLRSPEVDEASEFAPDIILSLPTTDISFIEDRGFRFSGAYTFHELRFGIWKIGSGSVPKRAFILFKPPREQTFAFITAFSDEHSLTTTRSRSAFAFPPPFGSFLQSFPRASIEDLWDAHVRGEQFVTAELPIPTKPCTLSDVEAINAMTVRHLGHVKSFRFWPIRSVYWIVLRRFLLHNRPIWRQDIPRLYIAAPNNT